MSKEIAIKSSELSRAYDRMSNEERRAYLALAMTKIKKITTGVCQLSAFHVRVKHFGKTQEEAEKEVLSWSDEKIKEEIDSHYYFELDNEAFCLFADDHKDLSDIIDN